MAIGMANLFLNVFHAIVKISLLVAAIQKVPKPALPKPSDLEFFNK